MSGEKKELTSTDTLPADGSYFEDSIFCPVDPSRLSGSIIFGIFLLRYQLNVVSIKYKISIKSIE